MKENAVAEKSFSFAIRVVKLCQHLCDTKKEYVLSKQLLRSGTSIGANVSEAQKGQSKRDFQAKMYIALKECSETIYWIRLLTATEYLTEKEQSSILADCVELEKLLTAITKSVKAGNAE
jgi:four helix bundle protein